MSEVTWPETDRRKEPMVCTVPCQPMDTKMAALYNCVKEKASQRLMLWLFGIFSFFFILLPGGFLWSIKDDVTEIRIQAEKQSVQIEGLTERLEDHLRLAEKKFDKVDRHFENEKSTFWPNSPNKP